MVFGMDKMHVMPFRGEEERTLGEIQRTNWSWYFGRLAFANTSHSRRVACS